MTFPLTIFTENGPLMDNTPQEAGMSFYEQMRGIVARIDSPVENLLSRGVQLALEDELEQALQLFAEACQQSPGTFLAWLTRGYTELSLLMYEDAEQSFLRARELDPRNVEVRYWLAHTHFLGDLVEEAIAELKEIITERPDFLDAYYDCGVALQVCGRYDDALEVFLQRLAISPDFDTLLMTAMTYEFQHDFENAETYYARALEMEPENAMVLEAHGATCLELDRPEDAMRDFTRALELDPENPDALYGRGRTFFIMEKFEEARQDLLRVVELDPESALAWSMLGQLMLCQEDYAAAMGIFNKALEADQDILIYGFRGQARFGMEDYEGAVADFTLAIDFEPDEPFYYQERGECLFYLGRAEDALHDFKTAQELDPEWDSFELRGLAHSELMNFEEAVRDLTRAIEMTPAEIDLYLYRAEAYSGLSNIAEAAADIRKARQLADEDGDEELVVQCDRFLGEIEKAGE